MKIMSWNLLRLHGASLEEVARLIRRESPDVFFMQEATREIDRLPDLVGGAYARAPLPGRIHGLAIWTPGPMPAPPTVMALPAGSMVLRVCQIIDLGAFSAANVHLSHGQLLNRRQLRRISAALPSHAAILGDFNLVGPALLGGFHDVGPRHATHLMGDFLPLRIDRCLVRGLSCRSTAVLDRQKSDHRPIVVRLAVAAPGQREAA
jgi:endonuclease/exonuclease/phosphatase family metal-dependent hydrolase